MAAVGIVPQTSTSPVDLPVLKDLDFPDMTTAGQFLVSQTEHQDLSTGQCVSSARGVLRNLVQSSHTFRTDINMALPSPPYSDPSSPMDVYSNKNFEGVTQMQTSVEQRSASPPEPKATFQQQHTDKLKSCNQTVTKSKPTRARRSRPPADKPSTPYMEMIARALVAAPGHSLILGDIYAFILQNYPYYQEAPSTWKNAVRHNLTVNDCFVKSGASKGGRGFYWAIHPACVEMFCRGDFRRMQARRAAQQQQHQQSDMAVSDKFLSSAQPSTPSPSPPPVYQVPVQMTNHQLSVNAYQQFFGNVDPYYFNQCYQPLVQPFNSMNTFNYADANFAQQTDTYSRDSVKDCSSLQGELENEKDTQPEFDYKTYISPAASPDLEFRIKQENDHATVGELLGDILTAQ